MTYTIISEFSPILEDEKKHLTSAYMLKKVILMHSSKNQNLKTYYYIVPKENYIHINPKNVSYTPSRKP